MKIVSVDGSKGFGRFFLEREERVGPTSTKGVFLMSGKMSSSADAMLQHAAQTQAIAAQLAGVSAFDPSMFQAPMMAGLGPIGAPFVAAYMAAVTNHMANTAEIVASFEAHSAAVQASSQAYSDTEGGSSDGFKSLI